MRMAAPYQKPQTVPQRARWLSRHSWHPSPESRGLRYLILPAFVAVVLLIVCVGIAVGTAATEMFQLYTHWLQSLARPGPWQ
jgi:hypothetical protein